MSLVHFIIGQSNGWGKGTTTYPVLGRHYRAAVSGRIIRLQDGSGNLKANDSTGSPLGSGNSNRESGTFSFEGAICDALVAGGIVGPHITVPCCRNGSASAEWITHLTQSPIHTTGSGEPVYIEEAKLRVRSALRATGAQLGSVIIYQGESDALLSTAAAWGTNWGDIRTEFNSFFAPWWASSMRYVVVQLPPTIPTHLTWPEWAATRAAQAAFVAANADCVMVTADESALVSGESYHLETAALRITGQAVGEAIVENWGLV